MIRQSNTAKLMLCALAATVLGGASLSAATVANGSFEEPVLAEGYNGFEYQPIVAGNFYESNTGVQRNGSAWNFADAPDGFQTAFVQDAGFGFNSINMYVSGLIVGKSYRFRFKLANRPGFDTNTLDVSFGSNDFGNFGAPSTDWKTRMTSIFIATNEADTLSFVGEGLFFRDAGIGLDAVSVAAVPEPASWGLFIAGFGLVGGTMRRRRQLAV
jgi:PEP-CTERM motif